MARLVEVGGIRTASLTVEAGDLLNLPASGGIVEIGERVVEALGPFVPGVVCVDGRILSPETPPTNMLFRAVRPGRARIALFAGLSGTPSEDRRVDIIVE